MSTPVLGKAGQAEILRASQKDQFFVSHLAQVCVDLCKWSKLSKRLYEMYDL